MRDTQRSKLYRAEDEALKFISKTIGDGSVEALTKRANEIAHSQTVADIIGTTVLRHVTISDGRGRRGGCANGWHLSMPRHTRNEYYLLHELAHVFTDAQFYHRRWVLKEYVEPRASHGWQFARIYLRLISRFMGVAAHDLLKASFKKHHVRFRPKRTRIMTEEQKSALRARLVQGMANKERRESA